MTLDSSGRDFIKSQRQRPLFSVSGFHTNKQKRDRKRDRERERESDTAIDGEREKERGIERR